MKTLLPLLALLLFIIPPAIAAGVGDALPHTLEASDQNGEIQSFETLKGEKGAVLVFVRSVDWCPFCQSQLTDLAKRSSEIEELGFNIITISYDSTEKQKTFADKYAFTHTILSDEESEIIKAFGILNQDVPPETSTYGIPHPSIFVVSDGGFITDKLAEEGYKNRPSVDAILEAIKN